MVNRRHRALRLEDARKQLCLDQQTDAGDATGIGEPQGAGHLADQLERTRWLDAFPRNYRGIDLPLGRASERHRAEIRIGIGAAVVRDVIGHRAGGRHEGGRQINVTSVVEMRCSGARCAYRDDRTGKARRRRWRQIPPETGMACPDGHDKAAGAHSGGSGLESLWISSRGKKRTHGSEVGRASAGSLPKGCDDEVGGPQLESPDVEEPHA